MEERNFLLMRYFFSRKSYKKLLNFSNLSKNE
ncbi:unnamed protein product [Larinioides sclopetarius]|uniref:Uncharacterized protein n=1 Tax=Larinioides sclopetarius TaxID=280406 RepID=A0AAV1ZUS2_9ARAC